MDKFLFKNSYLCQWLGKTIGSLPFIIRFRRLTKITHKSMWRNSPSGGQNLASQGAAGLLFHRCDDLLRHLIYLFVGQGRFDRLQGHLDGE